MSVAALPQSIATDPAEKEFRKKNLWYSFTTSAYGGLSIAAFLGALTTLAKGLIDVAMTADAGAVATVGAAGAATIFTPLPMLVIGGLLAIGLGASYMSQREATELKVVQDEHLAKQNAMQNAICNAPAHHPHHKHEQNRRRDDKQWSDVVQNVPEQTLTRH